MFGPGRYTESETLVGFFDTQLAAFTDSFTLRDDETLAATLADFDALRVAYLEQVRAHELGAEMTAPPDVIREEIDGASAPSLLMVVQGREGNAFVRPWARVG